MPVLVSPKRPLSLGDFARIYTGNGMTPEQVHSDLFFNAPLEGRNYMDEQWKRTGPGAKGVDPVAFFSQLPQVSAEHVVDHRPRGGSGPGPRPAPGPLAGAMPALDPNVSPQEFATLQKQRGGRDLENIMTSLMPEQDRVAYRRAEEARMLTGTRPADAPTLRPIRSNELENNPQFQSLLHTNPARAEQVYEASTGVSLRQTLQGRQAQRKAADSGAASTVRSLMQSGKVKWDDQGIPHLLTGKDMAGQDQWEPAQGPMLQTIMRATDADPRTGTNLLGVAQPRMNDTTRQVMGLMRQGLTYNEARIQVQNMNQASSGPAATTIRDLPTGPVAPAERGMQARRRAIRGAGNLAAEFAETGINSAAALPNLAIGSGNLIADLFDQLGGFTGLGQLSTGTRSQGIPEARLPRFR